MLIPTTNADLKVGCNADFKVLPDRCSSFRHSSVCQGWLEGIHQPFQPFLWWWRKWRCLHWHVAARRQIQVQYSQAFRASQLGDVRVIFHASWPKEPGHQILQFGVPVILQCEFRFSEQHYGYSNSSLACKRLWLPDEDLNLRRF